MPFYCGKRSAAGTRLACVCVLGSKNSPTYSSPVALTRCIERATGAPSNGFPIRLRIFRARGLAPASVFFASLRRMTRSDSSALWPLRCLLAGGGLRWRPLSSSLRRRELLHSRRRREIEEFLAPSWKSRRTGHGSLGGYGRVPARGPNLESGPSGVESRAYRNDQSAGLADRG